MGVWVCFFFLIYLSLKEEQLSVGDTTGVLLQIRQLWRGYKENVTFIFSTSKVSVFLCAYYAQIPWVSGVTGVCLECTCAKSENGKDTQALCQFNFRMLFSLQQTKPNKTKTFHSVFSLVNTQTHLPRWIINWLQSWTLECSQDQRNTYCNEKWHVGFRSHF